MSQTTPTLLEALAGAREHIELPGEVTRLLDLADTLDGERRTLTDRRTRDRFGGYGDKPTPEPGEDSASFQVRLAAWREGKTALAEALKANQIRKNGVDITLRRYVEKWGAALLADIDAAVADLAAQAEPFIAQLRGLDQRQVLLTGTRDQIAAARKIADLDERYQPLRWAHHALLVYTSGNRDYQTRRRAQRAIPATLTAAAGRLEGAAA